MNVSRDLLKSLRPEIDAALAGIAAKHGLAKLALGSATYTAGSFTFKLEGLVDGGMSVDAQRYEAEQAYNKNGRWPKVGEVIQWGAESLTVAGMGKGGKIYVTKDGKSYGIKRAAWERKYGGIFDS